MMSPNSVLHPNNYLHDSSNQTIEEKSKGMDDKLKILEGLRVDFNSSLLNKIQKNCIDCGGNSDQMKILTCLKSYIEQQDEFDNDSFKEKSSNEKFQLVMEKVKNDHTLIKYVIENLFSHSLWGYFSYNMNLYLNEYKKTYYLMAHQEAILNYNSTYNFDLINHRNIYRFNLEGSLGTRPVIDFSMVDLEDNESRRLRSEILNQFWNNT
jgi:hypothetical protein